MSSFAYELRHWSRKSCRFHLETRDLKFLESVFGFELAGAALNDELIQSLINEDKLVNAVLELPDQLHISPQLYFYVLLKRAFEESGIYNLLLVDYIVFLMTFHITPNTNQESSRFLYVSDYLSKIDIASNRDQFYLRVQLANEILILTGVFQEYMKHRTQRKAAPNIPFYEVVGCTQYEAAMHHPLAAELNLKSVFSELSTSFDNIRQTLNQFSERFISLGEPFRAL